MPWAKSKPDPSKYRTPAHKAVLAAYKQAIRANGYVLCAAVECVFPSRAITNTNGSQPDGVTAGHTPDGVTYNGPEHRRCNNHDATVRGNRSPVRTSPRRWVL